MSSLSHSFVSLFPPNLSLWLPRTGDKELVLYGVIAGAVSACVRGVLVAVSLLHYLKRRAFLVARDFWPR